MVCRVKLVSALLHEVIFGVFANFPISLPYCEDRKWSILDRIYHSPINYGSAAIFSVYLVLWVFLLVSKVRMRHHEFNWLSYLINRVQLRDFGVDWYAPIIQNVNSIKKSIIDYSNGCEKGQVKDHKQ